MPRKPRSSAASTRDTSPTGKPKVALVLQGGGALGAYQAGIYEALQENAMVPDWIVGTSIGAINAAIIAGNRHELRIQRLREFWNNIAHPDLLDMQQVPDATRQFATWVTTLDIFARGVPGFFKPRPFNPFALGLPVPPEAASFYNTEELRTTLNQYVDFDFLNNESNIRLTVSAVKVTSGTLVTFDSRQQTITVDHIMASGALPPGFAPVRIEGDLYWDGGLYSNTPLEAVLNEEPRQNTLCMMVDLWHADGPEPQTYEAVQTRQKDVTFASRSQRHIDAYLKQHELRRIAHTLYTRLPPSLRQPEDRHYLKLLDIDTTLHIIRLPYAGRDWNMASKDLNFAHGSVIWRWEQGHSDALRGIDISKHCSFNKNGMGIVVHELPALAQTSSKNKS